MNGPDVEGVLGRHEMVGEPAVLSSGVGWIWGCACRATGATAARSVAMEQYRAHVAAAVLAEVRAWMESEGAVSLIAGRMLKIESPDGLWAHLTPLERERFSNHATCALSALAEQVGQVASSRVPGEGS